VKIDTINNLRLINERKALETLLTKWESQNFNKSVFNIYILEKITNLSHEDLFNFLILYRPPSKFLENASEYELLDYIKKSAVKFKQNKEN
jgi:hypothetical protein